MINCISQQKINFTGKSFRVNPKLEDFGDKFFEKGASKFKEGPSGENYRAYANIVESKKVSLSKAPYGYRAGDSSIELDLYRGDKLKSSGLSTEAGENGGGWVQSKINIPLSTAGVGDCAVLNLVDKKSGTHVLYHVHPESSAEDIKYFIQNKFPNFTKVNIVPGNMPKTNTTVNNILSAVTQVNSKAETTFYHFASDSTEVIAKDGELSYLKGQKNGDVTFNQVNQYFYSPNSFI